MPTRYDVERALEDSDLPPVGRHIIEVLCHRMQQGSTVILQHHSPSLTKLARGTGWSRKTIMRYLTALEKAGWLERHRPPPELARTIYMTTLYVVHIPGTLGSGSAGLGSESAGLGSESAGLGSESAGNQICSDQETDHEIDIVIAELARHTGRTVSRQHAAKVRDQIANRPGILNRAGYLKRTLSRTPDRFMPTPEPELFAERCARCQLPGHAKKDCPY